MQCITRELFSHIVAGRNNEVKSMLRKNPDLLKASDEWWGSLLHLASISDNAAIIRHLIESGLHVDCLSFRITTPLMTATAGGRADSVEALLDANANIDVVDANGKTALQLLFDSSLFDQRILRLFIKKFQRDSLTTEQWMDKLIAADMCVYHAAFLDDKRLIESLLERGYSVNSKNAYGKSALNAAVEQLDFELAKWLIDRGADVNTVSNKGFRLLHETLDYGQVDMARLLLQHGANPNVKNHVGMTPLCVAIDGAYHRYVELLLEYGAVLLNWRINKQPIVELALAATGPRLSNLLVAHLAILDKRGMPIARHVLNDSRVRDRQVLFKFQNDCETCKRSLESKVYGELTLFDLLHATEDKMRILARNESLMSRVACVNRQLRKIYPLYFKLLRRRVSNAIALMKLENEVMPVVCEIFQLSYNQCFNFARKIIGYLNEHELQQLRRAYVK